MDNAHDAHVTTCLCRLKQGLSRNTSLGPQLNHHTGWLEISRRIPGSPKYLLKDSLQPKKIKNKK